MKQTALQPLALLAAIGLLFLHTTGAGDQTTTGSGQGQPAADTAPVDWDNYPAGQDPEDAAVQEAEAFEEELAEEAEPLLPWHDTLEDAIAAAYERRTGVMILFSGDTFRARTFEETLASEEVRNWLLNEFELYRVDYRPNRKFAHQYHVRQFPYMVILNRFGYTVGHALPVNDPDKLLERLAPYRQTLF